MLDDLKALSDYEMLSDVTEIIGTSAGSGLSLCYALGYNYYEIYELLANADFEEFLDNDIGICEDIIRVLRQYGWNKGDKLREYYENLIARKGYNKDLTFKELYEQRKIKLIITGTNLSKHKTEYFCLDSKFANTRIVDAIRISMSLPFIFTAVRTSEDEIFVDGGVLENFPVRYWDDVSKPTEFNHNTLGFILNTPEETKFKNNPNHTCEINSIQDFVAQLMNTVLMSNERQAHYPDHICDAREVAIETSNISSTDFFLTDEQMAFLIFQATFQQ